MKRSDVILVVVVLLVLITALQTIQIYSMSSEANRAITIMGTGNMMADSAAGSGFASQEEMMQAHHGSGAASGVGSC